MRASLARKRITYAGTSAWSAERRYCHVQPGPLLEPLDLAAGGCLLALLVVGAALHVLLVAFLPCSANATWYAYLPLALLTVMALAVRRFGVPPALLAVGLCVLLVMEMTARGHQMVTSAAGEKLGDALWLFVGLNAAWFLCMFLLLLGRLWSLLTWTGLILGVLAAIACKAALPLTPQPLFAVQLLYCIALTGTALYAARIYAGRCAALPTTPIRGTIRLVDLWQTGWEREHHEAVPRFGWWSALLMSLGSAAGYSTCVWLWADVIICDPLPYELPAMEVIFAGVLGTGPLVSSVCLRISPWRYGRHAVQGTVVAMAHWLTDEHPAPHAPGAISVSQSASQPIRLGICLAGLVGCAWSLIAQSPEMGIGSLEELAWRAPLHTFGCTLAFAAQGLASVALGVLVIGGPWFAYVGSIIAAAEAEELNEADSGAE